MLVRIAVFGMMLGCGLLPLQLMAQRPNLRYAGHVVDERGRPIPGAEVQVLVGDSIRQQVRTDSVGYFVIPYAAGLNQPQFRVRRFGYRARTLSSLRGRDDGPATIQLALLPTDLEAVRVMARVDDSRGKLREFYAHRATSKFGYFFDRDDIATKRGVSHLSDLMRFVPGARLQPGRIGSNVRLRECRPILWIDGVRLNGAELDETVSLSDVEAVEVYASLAGMPAQYIDRRSNCGAVVVWLK